MQISNCRIISKKTIIRKYRYMVVKVKILIINERNYCFKENTGHMAAVFQNELVEIKNVGGVIDGNKKRRHLVAAHHDCN